MLTVEQKNQINEILESLGENLDISETQFKAAVASYQAVGSWLSKSDSKLAPYNPIIKPQGSFILGTIIKPISDEDDLDIDLVCELGKKSFSWTQYDLKKIVGDQLRENKKINDLLDEEGRRCWTLKYREDSANSNEKYHMDILPAITSEGYSIILNEAYTKNFSAVDINRLSISITDNDSDNYYSSTEIENWHKSNPFGYAQWFFSRASENQSKRMFSLSESVKPVPSFQKDRFPLQRVVQILKRHRDIFYRDKSEEKRLCKPISIIITTLAARAYKGENNIIEALSNIINSMSEYIEDINPNTGESEKWIGNPINIQENFADKWKDFPEREVHFYDWLDEIKSDIEKIKSRGDKSPYLITESMRKSFGEKLIEKTFSNFKNKRLLNSTTSILSANIDQDINTELPKKLPKTKREGFQ